MASHRRFAAARYRSSVRDVTDSNQRSTTPSDDSSDDAGEKTNAAEGSPAHSAAPGQNGQASSEAAPSPLEVVTAERDKMREQLLRTAADFDNYRKRSKRDVDDARQRGKDDLVRDLLPVFDNLERAVQTADTASDLRSVLEGVRMVLKLFEDTAERVGLERVPSVGERFDPAVHEAIQQQETDAHAPGTIITEVVPGYRFGQRLVRPAMVVVARKPSEPKPEAGKPGESGGAQTAPTPGSTTVRPPAGASRAPASGSAAPGPSGAEPPDGGAEPKDAE
jgi:molecular chaperone GrpE